MSRVRITPPVRRLLAFFGSTPPTGPCRRPQVGGLQRAEFAFKQGKWRKMGGLISDEIRTAIAAWFVRGDRRTHIRTRVEGISDTVCLYQPGPIAVETLGGIVDGSRASGRLAARPASKQLPGSARQFARRAAGAAAERASSAGNPRYFRRGRTFGEALRRDAPCRSSRCRAEPGKCLCARNRVCPQP